MRELHVALSLVDGTVESEVGLALASALAGRREGLLLWRDAVLAGLLVSASVRDGLYFGVPQLIRAVAAEWLVDCERSLQLRQACSGLRVTSSSAGRARVYSPQWMILSQACGRQARQVSELERVCVALEILCRLTDQRSERAGGVEQDLHVPVRLSVVA